MSWTCLVTEEGAIRSCRAADEKLWVSITVTKHRGDKMLRSLKLLLEAAIMGVLDYGQSGNNLFSLFPIVGKVEAPYFAGEMRIPPPADPGDPNA